MSSEKEKILNDILQEVKTATPYIEGLILLTWEGLTIASNFTSPGEEELTAAICATLISLGENSSKAFNRGLFEYVFIKSKEKAVLLGKITDEAVLSMVTKSEAKVGVLIFELNKAKVKITEILKSI